MTICKAIEVNKEVETAKVGQHAVIVSSDDDEAYMLRFTSPKGNIFP